MLTPERPFIPEPSLSKAVTHRPTAPFRLTAPFVHKMNPPHSPLPSRASSDRDVLSDIDTFAPPVGEHIPPISIFLETPSLQTESIETAERVEEDLPPVEHFTDPLPAVEDFGAAELYERVRDDRRYSAGVVERASDAQVEIPVDIVSDLQGETGWVDTGWQQFDWTGAAALGEENDPAASSEWSQTDWDAAPPAERKETAAQAIANALDQIAQRIRNGDLLVPPADIVNDSAAIAATLAAMLGVRR